MSRYRLSVPKPPKKKKLGGDLANEDTRDPAKFVHANSELRPTKKGRLTLPKTGRM